MRLSLNRLRQQRDALQSVAKVLWRSGLGPALGPRGWRAISKAARRPAGPDAVFRIHAANKPEKLAVVESGRSRTKSYGELNARIDRLRAGLAALGVGRRDRVAVCMKNRTEYVEAMSALSRLGAATVNVSWRSTPDELVYLVDHSGSKVLVFEDWLADRVRAAAPRLAGIVPGGLVSVGAADGFARYEDLLRSGHEPASTGDSGGGAVIVYTSGTTGKPKGAVRDFPKEASAAVMHFLAELPFRHDDRHLVLCPLYHSAGFAFASMSFLLGATVVLIDDLDPENVLRTIERERITSTMAVPTMLHRLVALPDETRRRYDASSLRVVVSGAAPLSSALARRFQEAFGKVLYNFYGATETGLVTLAHPEELLSRPETIGRAIKGNDIRLVGPGGQDVSPGEVGELYVTNATLMAGYHADEAATRGSRLGKHFSVGDLARRDADGYYYIAGRKRDMIISGGVNVYPREVEDVLERHPAIAEAAVVGVPDEEWGERVRAFVALREGFGVEPAEIIAYCRDHLAGVKVPREVRIMDALPRNPTGKVLKTALVGS
ncbi:MAG: AMP-binding protein [Deltaproteobacteria bacterium]|nr:AMP-binding protein [Deltaproteobacteria bacterium]